MVLFQLKQRLIEQRKQVVVRRKRVALRRQVCVEYSAVIQLARNTARIMKNAEQATRNALKLGHSLEIGCLLSNAESCVIDANAYLMAVAESLSGYLEQLHKETDQERKIQLQVIVAMSKIYLENVNISVEETVCSANEMRDLIHPSLYEESVHL
jgi:hypothetical protein